MSAVELRTLEQCERVIERSQARFVKDASDALLAIHDQRLYREQYKSFEDYLLKRWGISRATGYRMLETARELDVAPKPEKAKAQVSVSQGETNTSRALSKQPIEATATKKSTAPAQAPDGESAPSGAEALGGGDRKSPQEPSTTPEERFCAAADQMMATGTDRAARAFGLQRAREFSAWAQRVERRAIAHSAEKTAASARGDVTPRFKGTKK